MTAIWRPESPALCEKNVSLSQRVQDDDTEIRVTPAARA
jgi:hypothetical protein